MAQSSFQFDPFHEAAPAALRRAAPARAGHFDELRGNAALADGHLRPAWKRFFDTLGVAGFRDLDRRAEIVRRQIEDDGITYNVYSEGAGPARPWSLDLLPFIIEEHEWTEIERGIAERAGLLESIVADAYGPQRLLREALLPPALVLGHPGYLRPMAGIAPAGGSYLQIIAFDLARAADGRWWVVSQRTQAPSGLGYALQNRLTIARLFPDAFREMRVQRLASAYRRLLDTLTRLAPDDAPTIVVLTPGPWNETYFEHAYLARYLGLPLVEGADLSVRDERVYLKSLHGLKPVHGILRRLDDVYCDPLELRHDSTLGIPGLLQAVRAGNVQIANALGAGFLESPALAGFLPAIARRAGIESLTLPSLDSWWCGEAAARQAALADLGAAVIKPTYPSSHFDAVLVAHTSRHEMDALRARIEATPELYTVQSFLPLSDVPTWSNGRLLPRGAMLRVMAIAGEGGRWHVLPGGLTRIAGPDLQVVSMQRGGSSLDTWVLTDGPIDEFSMLPAPLTATEIASRRRPVSSRAAENLFWMGRYSERAEWNLRLARTTLTWLSGQEVAPPALLGSLARMAEARGLVPDGGAGADTGVARAPSARCSPTWRATRRPAWRRTCSPCSTRPRRSGTGCRMNTGAWLPRRTKSSSPTSAAAGRESASAASKPSARSRTLRCASHHRCAYRPHDARRRLAAADHRPPDRAPVGVRCGAGRGFDSGVVTQNAGFELVLGLFDSTITYRALYQRQQEIAPLIDLLVFDSENPRALACVLGVLDRELTRLPGATAEHRALIDLLGPAQASAPLVATEATLDLLSTPDADGRYDALVQRAQQLDAAARELSDEIGRRFFSLSHDTYQSLTGWR